MTRILKLAAFACTLSLTSCASLLGKGEGHWIAYVDTEMNAHVLASKTCPGDYELWGPGGTKTFPEWYFRCHVGK